MVNLPAFSRMAVTFVGPAGAGPGAAAGDCPRVGVQWIATRRRRRGSVDSSGFMALRSVLESFQQGRM